MARPFPTGTFDNAHIQTYADADLLGERPKKPEQIEDFWGAARGADEATFRAGPPPAPKEHLIKFVTDYCDGLIFTSSDLRKNEDLAMVFLPAVMGAFEKWTDEAKQNIGVLYEYRHKALPRGVNGLPMFTSMFMLNADDWARSRKAIERELAVRNGTPRRVEEDLDADSDVDSETGGEHVCPASERGGSDPGEGGDIER